MSLKSNVEAFGIAMVFIVLMPIFGSFAIWELNDKGIIIDEFVTGTISITDLMVFWSFCCIILGIFLLFMWQKS